MAEDTNRIPNFMLQMAETISTTAKSQNGAEAEAFLQEMLRAKRIYVAGAGRSGFVAKAFAMRLMHLGFNAFVVGETVTPAFSAEDTLVAFSGSGETTSVVDICEIAKGMGGRVCLITANPSSRAGRIADCIVNLGDLTGYYKKDNTRFELRQITGQYRSTSTAFAPLGTLFETLALVFSDAVISVIMETRKQDIDEIRGRLTNVL